MVETILYSVLGSPLYPSETTIDDIMKARESYSKRRNYIEEEK